VIKTLFCLVHGNPLKAVFIDADDIIMTVAHLKETEKASYFLELLVDIWMLESVKSFRQKWSELLKRKRQKKTLVQMIFSEFNKSSILKPLEIYFRIQNKKEYISVSQLIKPRDIVLTLQLA